jgi:phytoene/squalene synthetase
MNLQLHLDYLRCQRIIQKHSASFYRAFSQLDDIRRRRGVYAVYAFCRYVDDLVDEKKDVAGLLAYKSELDVFVKTQKAKGFRWRALADTRKHFYPNESYFEPFYQMIEGQEFDAHPVNMATLAQLFHYCDLVASSVGLMLLPILAPGHSQDLSPFATALGRAFQLTNILRDIGEDFRRHRIYLPETLMLEHGYTMADLKAGTINGPFIALWEHLAQIAEGYYEQALTWIPTFPQDTQLPLHAALVIYRGILGVIRKHHYTVMDTKHFVKDQDKKIMIASILEKEKKR